MRWSDISSNPDNPNVIAFRKAKLEKLKSENLPGVREFLIKATTGAEIIVDVGYANHDAQTASTSGNWAHSILRSIFTKKIYGVDPVLIEDCDENCRHFSSTAELRSCFSEEQVQSPSLVAMNVLEHVESPHVFLRNLVESSKPLDLWLSTPNPSWVAHLYDWLNITNLSTNVDHVALFGPSELFEIAERLNLEVLEWGFFGIRDMPKRFRPGPGLQRLFWWAYYSICRLAKFPPAYNQVWIHLGVNQ